MIENQSSRSGIEDTSARDPLLHFGGMLGGTDRYITDMEAAGQRQLVNSTDLPAEMNSGTDDDLIALGFTLGEPHASDPMFRPATLPTGWSKQGTDHSMWSQVVDQHGRKRLSIFYKAAFYDRSAFINMQTVRGYAHDVLDGQPPVFDDEWCTSDALRAEVTAIRDDYAERLAKYGDHDNYKAEHIAAAERLLSQLDSA